MTDPHYGCGGPCDTSSRQFGDPDRWWITKDGDRHWNIFPPADLGNRVGDAVATFKTGAEAIAAFAFPTGEAS
jgi:hypothetical protein